MVQSRLEALSDMKEKKLKYIRILNTELDDLAEDIGQLMGIYRERCERGEVTKYVYLENNALFENEISCLKNFAQFTLHIELDRFETLEELCAFVEKQFKRQLKEGCYTHAIENVVERKLQKVLNYVKS
jgi:hypothetical protein